MPNYVGDKGLWDWLSYLFYEQLTKKGKNIRTDNANYFYIKRVEDYGKERRHAIKCSWQVINAWGIDSKFMFSNKIQERGNFQEQLLGRQNYFTSPGIMNCAKEIFAKKENGKYGFQKGGKGSVNIVRYTTSLQQLEVTFDLYAMSTTGILDLLPDTFKNHAAI
jgi:hypothetical protein